MEINQIGFVGGHGSDFDALILQEYLEIENVGCLGKLDLIDLRLGRDFLRETKKYDIVILNYIFNGYDSRTIETITSPLQSIENWRQRLMACDAKKIYVFGCYPISEITGEYIGKLPGYDLSVKEEVKGSIWTYVRKPLG